MTVSNCEYIVYLVATTKLTSCRNDTDPNLAEREPSVSHRDESLYSCRNNQRDLIKEITTSLKKVGRLSNPQSIQGSQFLSTMNLQVVRLTSCDMIVIMMNNLSIIISIITIVTQRRPSSRQICLLTYLTIIIVLLIHTV